jgi:tetratricopeptide (TPR) repeat protein
VPHGERLAAFEARLAQAAAAHPDDLDVVALHALSLIATAPPGDRSLAQQQRAGEILRALHAREATHPGAIHYGIHAFDHPPLAHRAVDLAHAYDQIAPEVPHALHMPTHIFVRLGHWPEVIDSNRRSAAAALENPVDGAVSHHYAHAADYLMYAYLQRGEDAAARRLLDELLSHETYQPTFISAYALAAAPARLALERGEWGAAATLPVGLPESIPWDRSPGALAIAHYARGLGGARGGDLDLARRSITELDRLEASAGEQDQGYWVEQIGIQRQVLAAWLALAEGREDEAVAAMTRAADLEDAAEKHPVTPGAVLPARELLGDLLLALDRPAEALAAYEASLEHSPRRFNTLARAARAAEAAGDAERARRHYRELVEVAPGGGRPELARAREALGS